MAAFISFSIDIFLAYFSYPLLFIILAVSVFIPIFPEEIIIITSGFLAYAGIVKFIPVFFTAVLGVMTADIIGYHIGRKKGSNLIIHVKDKKSYFSRLVLLGEKFFNRYDEHAVFLARFFVGIRFIIPILAGAFGMEWNKYIKNAVLGAIASVLFDLIIGYMLGYAYSTTFIAHGKRIALFMGIAVLCIYSFWKFFERKLILKN